jgi:hypothetical protein
MRPAIMMMEVYDAIMKQLFVRGWKNIDIPVKLSKVKKLWVAFRYGML